MNRTHVIGNWLPLVISFLYLAMSYAVFRLGPMEWNVTNLAQFNLYCACCFVIFGLGYALGMRRDAAASAQFPWRRFFWVGSVLTIVLIVPSTQALVGKWPWDAFTTFGCQSTAYMEMQKAMFEESVLQKIVLLLRGLASPFMYAVVPIAILYGKQLRLGEWLMVGIVVLCTVSLSLLRGTDKELGDLVIVMGAGGMVMLYGTFCARTVPLRYLLRYSVIVLMVVALGAALFMDRKASRMGMDCPECGCAMEGDLRLMPLSFLSVLPKWSIRNADPEGTRANSKTEFYKVAASFYLSNGYYGLSLALQQPFTSCYGFGHSFMAQSIATKLISPYFATCSYTSKTDGLGWYQGMLWSSGVTWIANDVGFVGALPIVGIFAMLLAMTWRGASAGNAVAFMLFAQFMLAVFYLPANNQLFISPDSYATLVFWLGYWLVLQYRPNKRMAGK